MTFLAYALYSGTRQPFGITKASLNPDHEKDPDAGPGYAPFNSPDWGSTYLGALDTIFLSFYAIGLFITGPLGDRLNLRWFLSIGMIGSGGFCFLFGSASLFNMHSLVWFIMCNIMAGLFQATGWPSTVTLMTRWFGQGNRGTIMGIWNAQSSVGNIVGKCKGKQTQQDTPAHIRTHARVRRRCSRVSPTLLCACCAPSIPQFGPPSGFIAVVGVGLSCVPVSSVSVSASFRWRGSFLIRMMY